MDTEEFASALRQALESDGEVDPDALLAGWPEDDAPESFVEFESYEGVESRRLASLVWDGGMISSFLAINALRLGSSWFVYFESNDFEMKVLDHMPVLDAATSTLAVEGICSAHEYISFALPDEIEVDDLVDRPRIVACFKPGEDT